MEVPDSIDLNNRSPLAIDLNEIPVSPPPAALPGPGSGPDPVEIDAIDVVRSFHENQDPAPGAAAGLPEGEGVMTCGSCGLPEGGGHVVVCDGCERGFHVACAGMRGVEAAGLVDWMCGECVGGGVESKRWRLGVMRKRVLDMNASPPSDGDGDGDSSEDRRNLRKRSRGMVDNLCSRSAFGAPVTRSSHVYEGNGFGCLGYQKGSSLIKASWVGVEDTLNCTQTLDRSLEEIDLDIPIGKLRNNNNNTSIMLPSRSPNEFLLHGLRKFVSERHGVLDEGWNVEIKHCTNSNEFYAVYHSPDGKTFGSMSEVACYLMLPLNYKSMDADAKRDGSPSIQELLHVPKKRKTKRLSLANGFAGHEQSVLSGCHRELMANGQSAEIGGAESGKLTDVVAVEDGNVKSPASDDGLPVQFEDFFVISFGKIDVRPSYHNPQQIWPVGYKSCWHDKVTGSLFICEVLDGGDSGPVFKVRRFSCSALPIPDGSTVLYRENSALGTVQNMNSYVNTICCNTDCDNDLDVEMILADASPPTEGDVFSCFKLNSNANSDIQIPNGSVVLLSGSQTHAACDLEFEDATGEMSAEGRSSSLAWRTVCQNLIGKYSKICSQKGHLKLCCKHVDDHICSAAWDRKDKIVDSSSPESKFCSSSISGFMPLEFQGETDGLSAALWKWLDEDRFGFDAHFVQEIIEQLPGLDSCSKYEPLINRIDYSVSLTVGNRTLAVKRKRGTEFDDSKESKRTMLGRANCVIDDRDPPLGRTLCSKIPPVLAGDMYQVWESLFRFHSLLGLNEPLMLDRLVRELMSSWLDGENLLEDLERKFRGNQVTGFDKVDGLSGPEQCSYQESHKINGDSSHFLLNMESKATNDLANAPYTVAHCRCSGVALIKVHTSLLSMLIGELQLKVAPTVDPSFDSGELKPRRGRRKDVDSSTAARRSRLITLPINELTWPELARRYIWAVICMDGNLESAEIIARERAKVFCCLHGDGGVPCGSLAGVAGMEADALLLAEATKQIYGSLCIVKDVLTIEEEVSDPSCSSGESCGDDGIIPEWAKVLEPVRKLPTNVGTRIRNCVYEALTKDPPEWAKERLLHSISKGVYKGNASGPTKKAVLSVLEDVRKEGFLKKPEKKRKRMSTIHISEVIMKKCRCVLRQVLADDEAKQFANLLGRILTTYSDHSDEGLLGSPAMVSRPLDFRMIDLRLAAGAYGGSLESFLEDIHELWNNIRAAFRDQSDVLQSAETLSETFDSLYEKEVVPLVQIFEQYAKLEHLSAETMKELEDIVASTSKITKAPWDDGVCKVCGVDRDDKSVLLCDKCNEEYHTYCLNPPLARIPDDNWYCPRCVAVPMVQEASSCFQTNGRFQRKKNLGEFTHVHLDTLMHLAVSLEQKDYWDFGIDERIFLLKFLCDELVSSPFVHQNLELSIDTASALQQKLRSLVVEWRNLKSKEELAAKAAKMDIGGKGDAKDALGSEIMKQSSSVGKPSNFSDNSSLFCAGSDGVSHTEKKRNVDSQDISFVDTEDHVKDLCGAPNGTGGQGSDKSSQSCELPLPKELQQATDHVDEVCGQSKMDEYAGRNSSISLPSSHQPESSISSEMNLGVLERVPSIVAGQSQTCHSELSKIKDDVFRLQRSINNMELKILKQSIRREFLGSDSRGRWYWVSSTHDGLPVVVVVDGGLGSQQKKSFDHANPSGSGSAVLHSSSAGVNTGLRMEGSRACDPLFLYPNYNSDMCTPWVSYETEEEIEALIGWLRSDDQKERDLKESLLQVLKLRSPGVEQIEETSQDEGDTSSASVINKAETSSSDCLVTKAALFLEKKYGVIRDLRTCDVQKRGGKNARGFIEEKIYRCHCLEPIWPSRQHCHSCHRTSDDGEFEGHDDGKCKLTASSLEKNEESSAKRDAKSDDNFQNEGESPYNLSEISMKFVTEDSNKKLVEGIGLIGSNGIPSFVTSTTPYLSDSTLILPRAKKSTDAQLDNSKTTEPQGFLQGNRSGSPDNSPTKAAANETSKQVETNESSLECNQKGGKSDKCSSEMRFVSRCVAPRSSLKPLTGKVSPILRKLKICLLDMEASLSSEALRPSKRCLRRRWAWRAHVKSAGSIYQMIQATIMLEDMIKTENLRNEWWYWSSLSAAARISTVSSLTLRIFSLDASIIYEKPLSDSDLSEKSMPGSSSNQNQLAGSDSTEKSKGTRKSNKKRKEPEV